MEECRERGFKVGDRLVGDEGYGPTVIEDGGPDEKDKKPEKKRRHPFIEGLLETLPAAVLGANKTEWSLQGRQEWLQTAARIFNLIYVACAEDKGGSVSVSVARPPNSSAN